MSPAQLIFDSLPVLETNRATVTATGSDVIDMKGFQDLLVLFEISAVAAGDGSNYLLFTVQESNDATFGDGTEVTITDANRLFSTAPLNTTTGEILRINSTAMANTLQKFGLKCGVKRYIKVIWTETGTASATFSMIAIKADPLCPNSNVAVSTIL